MRSLATMRVRSLTVVLGLGLIVAACGGDDDAADSTTTATSTTTIAVATTTLGSAQTTTGAVPTSTTTTTTTVVQGVTLPASDIFITTGGMGPIRIGMTVEEAAEAAGFELAGELEPDISETCYYVMPPEDQAGYLGVAFMVENDKIVRVEVGRSAVTTRSGARVGMSETELRAMFPGQIENAPDAVVDGRALQFVPTDERDANYRVIFVFDGETVTQLRAGVLPAVGYGEGCL